MSIFSENLKKYRLLKNLKQQDMANFLKIDKSTYSNYENGRREPNILTIKKICNILEISGDMLLGLSPITYQSKNDLSIKEKEHLNNYRRLNDERKKRIDKIINMELEEQDEMDFINSSRTFPGSTS